MGMLKWVGWAGAGMLGWAATLPFQAISGSNDVLALSAHTIYNGLNDATGCCGGVVKWEHFGWHDSEGGFSALDLSRLGFDDTSGVDVFLNSDGNAVNVEIKNHLFETSSLCTGVHAIFKDSQGNYLGHERYTHITPVKDVIGMTLNSDDIFLKLGTVSAGQVSGCPWDAPHLHQSGHNITSTALFTNWGIPCSPNPTGQCMEVEEPQSLFVGTWMHELRW